MFAESDDPQRLVPIVTEPARFLIAVAGDRNRANALAMAHDGLHGNWTATYVDRSRSLDLACVIGNETCGA